MSVRCQAERERRMALEALVGGKRFCPLPVCIWISCP
jgi:hypothetical protein